MKRILVILVSVVGAFFLCFLSYLKGHAEGVQRSRVTHMGFDVSCLKKLEEGKLEWAKSDQALFLWSALNAEEQGLGLLGEWMEWRKTDTDERYERHRSQAQAFVAKYRNTFVTVEQIDSVLEEKLGLPMKAKTK